MKKILRVCSYPTKHWSGMGLNSYMLSGMDRVYTIYLSPFYEKETFPVKKNTVVNFRQFMIKPYPKDSFLIKKIVHNIKRIIYILYFFIWGIYFIHKKRVDIVHIHSPMHFLIALWAKIFNKKVYISYHGIEFHSIYNNRFLTWIFSKVFDCSFSLSPDIMIYKKVIENNGSSVELIFNSVDAEVYKNEKKQRKKQIIAVGRLEEQKGYSYLLDGFSKFVEKNSDYDLIIVGTGSLKSSLIEQCRELGIESKVFFVGQKSREELVELYNQSEIFILSSIWEGFPKVLMEAIACGCKIVSTNIDAVPTILGKDYEYIIDSKDKNRIFLSLESIIKKDYNFFWDKYSKILKKYSWEKQKKRFEELYLL